MDSNNTFMFLMARTAFTEITRKFCRKPMQR